MPHYLRTEGLTKSFGSAASDSKIVLDRIDLDLRAGEITVLLGASGCGKTTLLRILAGIDSEFEGRVETSIARPGPEVGFLQQGERLIPWRSVAGNVTLGLELIGRGRAEAHARARHFLQAVDLADASARYPSEVSGGMAQRALLARTLAVGPRLLLLDEPYSQLDVASRRKLCEVLRSYVHETGSIALLVTHSVEEAVVVGDMVHVLSRDPCKIVRSFAIGAVPSGLERNDSFEPVLEALVGALSGSEGAGGVS